MVVLAGLLSSVSAISSLSTSFSTTHTSTSTSTHKSGTTVTTHTSTTTPITQASTTISSTATVTPTPNVAEWGDCGGIGYTGGTICPVDWICTVLNAYFSQCLPGPNFTFPPPPPTPTTTAPAPVKTVYNYVVSFGDSWTTTGFDFNGTAPALGNQLGNPEFPGKTTSGGPNWVSDLLPDNSQLLSYNFATDGATIDASIIAPQNPNALTLVDQVSEFLTNLAPVPEYAPFLQNNTLFVIWMGTTDMIIAWNETDWPAISEQLVDSYFEQIELLYNAGARNFIFPDVPPIQRTPAMLGQSVAEQQGMATAITQFNAVLNTQANSLISTKLGGQFPNPRGFAQVIGANSAFNIMLDNPTAYGSPDATCVNSDGVSCLWASEWYPGQEIQSLVSSYIAVDVGLWL